MTTTMPERPPDLDFCTQCRPRPAPPPEARNRFASGTDGVEARCDPTTGVGPPPRPSCLHGLRNHRGRARRGPLRLHTRSFARRQARRRRPGGGGDDCHLGREFTAERANALLHLDYDDGRSTAARAAPGSRVCSRACGGVSGSSRVGASARARCRGSARPGDECGRGGSRMARATRDPASHPPVHHPAACDTPAAATALTRPFPVEPGRGLEPLACSLRVSCSTS
jgi:hypothetical protein